MEDIKEMSEQKEDIVMSEPSETDKAEETKEMGCEDKTEQFEEEKVDDAEKVEDKEMSEQEKQPEEEKEMADDSDDCDCEDEKEMVEQEKKFSLEQFGEFDSTEDEFANKVLKEMSAKEIFDTIMAFSQENVELKQFKQARLDQDRDDKVDSIMAKVKEDLDTKTFADLSAEGKTLGMDELAGFENKVKSFAYDASFDKRQQMQEDIMTFSGNDTQDTQADLTADDIYNKYL